MDAALFLDMDPRRQDNARLLEFGAWPATAPDPNIPSW